MIIRDKPFQNDWLVVVEKLHFSESTGYQSTGEQAFQGLLLVPVPTLTTRITRKTSGAGGAWPERGRQHPPGAMETPPFISWWLSFTPLKNMKVSWDD